MDSFNNEQLNHESQVRNAIQRRLYIDYNDVVANVTTVQVDTV